MLRFRLLLGVVFAALPAIVVAQSTVYVDITATPPGNGTQASPFTQIASALIAAQNGDTVLVAPGTYVETLTLYGKSLAIKSTDGADVTIIDGGGSGTVLALAGFFTPTTPTVEGFTITNGNGFWFIGGRPGGVAVSTASATFTDCKITGNVGGGGAVGGISLSSGNLTMVRCDITDNIGGDTPFNKGGLSGRGGPGGVSVLEFSTASTLVMRDCLVSGNQGGHGFMFFFTGGTGGAGAVEVVSSVAGTSCTLTNCTVVANTGGNGAGTGRGGAGGFGLGAGSATITHCTVVNNTGGIVTGGAGILGAGGLHTLTAPTTVDIANSIFWENRDGPGAISEIEILAGVAQATFCDVAGGFAGAGNINADPLLRDPALADYHLTAPSPCIDAGDSAIAGLPSTDFEGDPRNVGGGVDIGADEACLLGSDEGFALESLVNGLGAPHRCHKEVVVGDVLTLTIPPPNGAFVGSVAVGYLQFFPSGPGPVTPLGLPEVHIDPFAQQVLYFSISPLLAGGYGLTSPIPSGLSGTTIRVQFFAVSPAAANTLFAATGAHDIACL